MHKIKFAISCVISIFLILFVFTGISIYIERKDFMDLFMIVIFTIPTFFSIRYSFRKIKFLKETVEPTPNQINISNTIDYDSFSIEQIQNKYNISLEKASKIMDEIYKMGYVGEADGYQSRKLLCDEYSVWDYIETILDEYSNTQISQIPDYDSMEGHEFERFCASVLRRNRFFNVEVTQGSGDHGIDILAERDGITYAIQCKCYSSNIGNAAVQQAHTGKSIYKKDIAVVLTNRYFTKQAIEEAKVLGVKLWDRNKLNEMTNNG